MKPIIEKSISLFGYKSFYVLLVFIALQQIFVALSVPSIAKLVDSISSEGNVILSLYIVGSVLVLPYIPSVPINVLLERWKFDFREMLIKKYTRNYNNRIDLNRDEKERQRIISMASYESGSISESFTYYVQDLIALVLNILFTSLAIVAFVDSLYAISYLATVVTVFFLYKLTNGWISRATELAVNKRLDLSNIVSMSWQNITLPTSIFKSKLLNQLFGKLSDARAANIKRVLSSTISSSIASFISVLALVLTTFYLFHKNLDDFQYLSIIVATLPRQVQLMSYFYNLIEHLFNLPKVTREVSMALESFNSKEASSIERYISKSDIEIRNSNNIYVGVDKFCSEIMAATFRSGRYLITGKNGAGKSTLGLHIANIDNEGIYLPTSANMYIENSTQKSSGERYFEMIAILEEVQPQNCVIVFDEWDANLDAGNREQIDRKLTIFSRSNLVLEIRHIR